MTKMIQLITWIGLPTRWIGIAIVLLIAVPTLVVLGSLHAFFGQKPYHDQHVD